MKDLNILSINGIDIDKGIEFLGDSKLYDDTLCDFLDSIDTKINELSSFKETNDCINYSIISHSIKSDSKFLGFISLSEIAQEHELAGKSENVDYIDKNFDSFVEEIERIRSVVKKYMKDQGIDYISGNPDNKDKTILVVDDSDLVRAFIKKVFHNNYRVMVAHDGKEAMAILSTEVYHNIVAVLLDLNMPNVDGFEVLDFFEVNKLFNKIPVSIITGDDAVETTNRAFTYKVTDVLHKPFTERDVKNVVEKMLLFKK